MLTAQPLFNLLITHSKNIVLHLLEKKQQPQQQLTFKALDQGLLTISDNNADHVCRLAIVTQIFLTKALKIPPIMAAIFFPSSSRS